MEQLNAINEKIIELSRSRENKNTNPPADPPGPVHLTEGKDTPSSESADITHHGRVIMDATVCPQDIAILQT